MDNDRQYASQDNRQSEPSTIALERPLMGPPTLPRYLCTSFYPARSEDIQFPVTSTPADDYGSYDSDQKYYVDPSHASMESSRTQISSHQAQSQQNYPSFGQDSALLQTQQQGMQSMYEHVSQCIQSQAESTPTAVSHYSILPYPQQHSEGPSGRAIQYIANETADGGSYPTIPPPITRLRSPFVESSPSFKPQYQAHAANEEIVDSQAQLEREKRQYTHQVQLVCELIIAERVTEAKDKLLAATRWLVASVVPLGLDCDDEQVYAQRITMWAELNHCWEALGLKQKDITEKALNDLQQPPDILTAESICRLLDDLVALCDQLEPFGLVDYELGLWEEQIVEIFEACLDLLPQSRYQH